VPRGERQRNSAFFPYALAKLMLDVRRMRILREVAARGSIAAAAQALSFTPSAVSQQLAALEREAGVALVERGPRSVRLTDAGRALVAHTDAIVARLAAAEDELQAIAGLRDGTLRVASFPTAYATVMPAAIAEFRRRHPGVELTLTEADPRVALRQLKAGELDLALLYEYDFVPLPDDAAVERVRLLEDPIRLVLARNHPAARRRSVRLADLADESWVTSTARSSCHLFVERACRAAGFEPNIGFESDDHGVWQGLAAAGVGVALAPDLALTSVHPGVAVRPIALQPLERRIDAAFRTGGRRLPAVAAMLDVLADAVAARTVEAVALVGASA
jgi:DNA-binding transcriptional LysR family regulator